MKPQKGDSKPRNDDGKNLICDDFLLVTSTQITRSRIRFTWSSLLSSVGSTLDATLCHLNLSGKSIQFSVLLFIKSLEIHYKYISKRYLVNI